MPAAHSPFSHSQSPAVTRRGRRGGFALLITVTLLAFLVLILVSLASLTRVETQVATNTQHLAQARQNALMALNMAIGQLQKHAGPDQRVTARADVIAPDGMNWSTLADPEAARTADEAAIEDSWTDSPRNRNWTGVWKNTNLDPYNYNPNTPSTFNSDPELQAWLVSGNENAPDTFKPTDTITDLSAATTPLDRLSDGNGNYYRLLLKAAAGVTDAASLQRAVTAPEVPIRSTSVPGIGEATLGHYAWWVGDEGVKARANLIDPYADGTSDEVKRIRLQSAQRIAIEAMTTNGTDGLATDYPVNDANLSNVFTTSQLGYLSTTAAFPTELKARYHDLSVTSRGVLADVKNGGLKADLSYLFGQPDLDDFRAALRALYGTNDIAPLNPNPNNRADLANPLLSPTATPLAAPPSNAPDSGDYTDRFKNTATWEQLWSFANQGSTFNNAGEASPRHQTATQHGLYPLVIQTKMFYRLRISPTLAELEDAGVEIPPDNVNRIGKLSVDTLPLIVLANPYAVPLAAAEYQVRISGSSPQLVFGKISGTTMGTPSPTDDFTERAYPPTSGGSSTEVTYAGNITFVLQSDGMAPGGAQIFTIDPRSSANPSIDPEGRIVVNNSNDNKRVYMTNEFDQTPALTFNTPKTIPEGQTHAALRVGRAGLGTTLYMDYNPGDKEGHRKTLQYTQAQTLTDDAEFGNKENYIFVVDPMSDDIRQGGGVMSIINQPPTKDRPAAKPGTSPVFFSHQQAPFLQVNYRTSMVTWSAPNSGVSHPLEWARRMTKNGSTGSAGNAPNPWFAANLLRPPGSTTHTRWGIVNIGEGQEQTVPPESIGGSAALNASHVSYNLGFNNYLYDIPRPDHPLSSLGQLQHFNTVGYIPDTSISNYSSMNSWQTNYPLSNSYPQPRVPRDQLFNYANNKAVSLGYHYDGSYIWNDIFWDRFTLSTFPQGNEDFDFATNTLINSRYRPFRDRSIVPWDDETFFRGSGDPASAAADARAAAQNLLVEGAFNINSTSVEAWKAVFSSLRNVPAGTETDSNAPFSRILTPLGGSANAASGVSPNSWNGIRDLSADEVQALAEEMVMQVRKRGPFTSLSHFVNRQLTAAATDQLKLGLSGALQAALDAVVNQTSLLSPEFNVKSSATSRTSSTNVDHIAISDLGYILPSALAGFPGYMLQGDVLSALGSSISARSDTFTIRAYGDSVNPATGDLTGQAWCEAVVQRLPDYVEPDADAPHAIPAAGTPNDTFGRRFHIVSFRWLSPDEI